LSPFDFSRFGGSDLVSSLLRVHPWKTQLHLCRRLSAITCAFIVGWLAAALASATVLPWMSLEEITARSDVIVLGKVEAADSGWSDDGRIIVTRATVSVERALKGGPRVQVIVETAGGRIGDVAMIASGAPVFRAGRRTTPPCGRGLEPRQDGREPRGPVPSFERREVVRAGARRRVTASAAPRASPRPCS